MFRIRTFVSILALLLVTAAVASGAALASGGATPLPTGGTYCPQHPALWVVQLADGSTVYANEASGDGCVFVRSYPAGYLRLDSVILAPGWTYVVLKNGEGTTSRVQLLFTELATGRTVDFRVEYGKTKIG
jgi:hypothetical protein